MSSLSHLYSLFNSAASATDAEFARAREFYSSHIAPNGAPGLQCRNGCSSCCSQLFEITLLEAAVIARHVKSLPEDHRERLRARAREYRPQRKQLEAARAAESAPQGLVQLGSIGTKINPTGLRLPCPALENDACSIYRARPLICRKFGMPIYSPNSPDRLGACELNFADGEEFPDTDGIVRRQSALHDEWDSVTAQVAAATGMSMPPLTVADALLADYDSILRDWTGD